MIFDKAIAGTADYTWALPVRAQRYSFGTMTSARAAAISRSCPGADDVSCASILARSWRRLARLNAAGAASFVRAAEVM